MKHLLVFLTLFIFGFSVVYSQGSLNLGTSSAVSNCNLLIYDDGGNTGDYSSAIDHILTITSNDPNNGCVMVEIQSLDIDESDTLYFYDGADTTGPLLQKINNSNYNPTVYYRYAATIQNTTGALTIRFKTDSTGVGEGFELKTSCIAPCQRVILSLDSLQSTHIPHLNPDDDYYYLDVCPYDTVHLVINCTYPDNDFSYHQDNSTTTFKWDFDLEEFELTGANVKDYYFTPGRGYDVAISAIDVNLCPSLIPITFRVRTSKNHIKNVVPQPPVCTGDELHLSVGYDNLSALQLTPVGSEQITSLAVVDTIFLPDGISCPPYGYYYRSYVNFTTFAPNATITSANDILYVRLKIEHSAIEDIRISLVCPNGSRCKIVPDYQNDGWGGVTHYFRTNLGVANRLQEVVSCNAAQNPMGIAWNYVWSNNTTLGYQYANTPNSYCYEPGNVHSSYNPYWDDGSTSYKIDSTDVANMTQVYHPLQNFSGMVGCPLNGNWFIEIEDVWTNDNGYLHEWEMALDPALLPQNWSYEVAVDTIYITGPGASGTEIIPQQSGNIPYTFNVIDEFGCLYDTIMYIDVFQSPQPDLGEDRYICYGDLYLLESHWPDPTSTFIWNTGERTSDIYLSSSGEYTLNVFNTHENGLVCTGADTIQIMVSPKPVADFSISDTTGCAPLTVSFTNLSTSDSSNTQYYWFCYDDKGQIAFTADQKNPVFTFDNSGTYTVMLTTSNAHGCKDSVIKYNCISISYQPEAEFDAIPDVALWSETDGSIYFQVQGDTTSFDNNMRFYWDFGDGNTDSSSFALEHSYSSWGDYEVTLSMFTSDGCNSSITHTVTLEADLVFPNVITPNDDGINDVFAIGNLNTSMNEFDPDKYRNNELTIYDRWGKQVYHAVNYDTFIDLTGERGNGVIIGDQVFDGTNVNDGSYFFTFYYKGKFKTVNYHGTLQIIRDR
jgi:PKD repeat protein